MKRIEKIYCYLAENTQKLSMEEVLKDKGFETSELSEQLNILRNNVSKELNNLLRLDKIIKIKGRPVKFLHKASVEKILNVQIKKQSIEVGSISEILFSRENEDPFEHLIGAEKSLKNQVEQAKAAIIYPPVGLHTLIFGQTGVGKTLFARMMYNYGKYIKRFSENTPFIIFNCADYYNNPQLLLAHIFGYIKGAFTGADHDKEGLVEKANGGILFLDEIHRLPPEGQEMIFYFMDTGTYNKLGETERKRKANILIVGATTEDPNSYMLKTFMRRIPIIISIPSLQERTVEEKIDIIKYLFVNEAHRVNKKIKISTEVVKALIGSASYGNIGQLKSNIQLTCAKGFLSSINNRKGYIELDFKILPSDIKSGLFEIGRNHKEFEEIGNILDAPLLVSPDGYKVIIEDSEELPFNLYKLIEDKISLLKEEKMNDHDINKFIITDLNMNLKIFYNKFNKNNEQRDQISKIIDKEILEFAEKMKDLAETDLARKYSDRFVYALSFHVSLFLKRIKDKKYDNKEYIYHSLQDNDEEFKVALKIKDIMNKTFQVEVPDIEVTYIAILLKSVEEEKQEQVSIIVAAHGSSTASSMVSVVKELLGEVSSVCAVDMPLHVSPKEILEVIIDKVKSMDKGKGVLLLVDMGSLFKFEATIIEKTGVKVKTIDMVSTPLVLEAVRKSSIFNMELNDIYNSLGEFKGYNNELNGKNNVSDKVIVTVCTSGIGTAIKLKEIVENIILNLTEENIDVIPVEIRELDKKIKVLLENSDVLAVVGVKKPKENIPFIPLEKLIDGNGEKILREIITGNQFTVLPQKQSVVIKDLCVDNLKQFLIYLNPHKIIGILLKFVNDLEKELNVDFDNSMKIRIIFHVGYALERIVVNDGLKCVGDKDPISALIVRSVDNTCEIFKKALNISLTDDEKYFICKMLTSVEV
jgi:transcriptional regulatory protein LevR/transcriptional regulator with AAA-type ATPase domain